MRKTVHDRRSTQKVAKNRDHCRTSKRRLRYHNVSTLPPRLKVAEGITGISISSLLDGGLGLEDTLLFLLCLHFPHLGEHDLWEELARFKIIVVRMYETYLAENSSLVQFAPGLLLLRV